MKPQTKRLVLVISSKICCMLFDIEEWRHYKSFHRLSFATNYLFNTKLLRANFLRVLPQHKRDNKVPTYKLQLADTHDETLKPRLKLVYGEILVETFQNYFCFCLVHTNFDQQISYKLLLCPTNLRVEPLKFVSLALNYHQATLNWNARVRSLVHCTLYLCLWAWHDSSQTPSSFSILSQYFHHFALLT